ncbi:sugar ABC transporter permease [uncultured Cetobacterium sp.]|uniref:carbohydrate ABC transporter permease n=1 Tax=uncultured Cetobacterium sp. TaxID=527638 RepID=UPI0026380EE0|nr:sugar ABC transporter permease [uncultured Cetobacterium sp.]
MKKKETLLAVTFLMPALTIFTIFIFYPICKTVYLSFFQWNMISKNKKFIGLENYIDILTEDSVHKSLINTLIYIGLLIIFNFILPYIIAYILAFLVNKFKGFYRTMFFFPSIISLVVASLVFVWVFNPMIGPISKIYELLNLKPQFWLKTNGLVMVLITLITAWKIFGYNLILLLAGILEVPTELIESAKLDKVSNLQIFLYIVIPMTSSTALYVIVMTIVYGLQQVFVPINVLTQGGPNNGSTNLVYSIYQYAFTFFQTGRASALSVITMLFFFILISIKIKVLEKGVYYEN